MKKYILEGWIDGTLHLFPNWEKWHPVNFPIEVEADVEYENQDDNLVTVYFMNNRAPETFKLRHFKYKIK